MLINTSKLKGCKIHASDGNIGELASLYFDCRQWKVRYFAVETGSFLNKKTVLIPSAAVPAQNLSNGTINVNLTRDQVKNSPDVDLSLSVSRAAELEIARHYNLPLYWDVENVSGLRSDDFLYIPDEERAISVGKRTVEFVDEPSATAVITERITGARYLYSTEDICGYDIQAVDGEIGEVQDFICDDTTRNVRYAVADLSGVSSGKKVLLSPMWIDSINDRDEKVRVDLRKDAIRNSPAYDAARPIEGDYERRLFEYYNKDVAESPFALWRFNYMRHAMAPGKKLRIVVMAPALVRWSSDEWKTSSDVRTHDTGMGIHIADLDSDEVKAGKSVHFTFFWPQANHWEGKNFSVRVRPSVMERKREPAMAGAAR